MVMLCATSLVLPTDITMLLTVIAQLLVANYLRRSKLTSFFSNFKKKASHRHVLSVVGSSRVKDCKIVKLVLCFTLLCALLDDLPLALTKDTVLTNSPFSGKITKVVVGELPCTHGRRRTGGGAICDQVAADRCAYYLFSTLVPVF